MRAWVLDEGSDAYRLGEVASPGLGPWDVRVSLRASALNHLDLWVARGMPAPPAFPHVGGADGAGVVIEAGGAVEDVAVGDEVIVDPATSCGTCGACLAGETSLCPQMRIVGEHRWGTHADEVVVPATNVRGRPEGMSWDRVGSFGLVVGSAVRMAHRGRLGPGRSALIVGVGGGSATAMLQVARALGASPVFATSRRDEARAWATAQGATAFDSEGDFAEEVRAATEGRGVDVVFDNVGSATFERSLRSLARGGRLVTNGSTSGREATVHLPTLFWRQLEIVGASMHDRSEFADAVALAAAGEVDVPIATTFAFEDYPAALERLREGVLGKIVLSR